METTTFTVVYPVYVALTRMEGETDEDFKERALTQADKIMESTPTKPYIHECSNLGLID